MTLVIVILTFVREHKIYYEIAKIKTTNTNSICQTSFDYASGQIFWVQTDDSPNLRCTQSVRHKGMSI